MTSSAPEAIVIDDHASMRRMTRRLLDAAGYRVVGEAESGQEGLEMVRRFEPELVLLDLVLPDMCGTDVARTLRDEGSPSGILLMSSYDREDIDDVAKEAGTLGFVPKTELTVDSIRELDISAN